jgi:hypothetical protein
MWVEIRCLESVSPDCFSAANNGPADTVSHVRAVMIRQVRKLEQEAVSDGWKRVKQGVICPECVKALDAAKHS